MQLGGLEVETATRRGAIGLASRALGELGAAAGMVETPRSEASAGLRRKPAGREGP